MSTSFLKHLAAVMFVAGATSPTYGQFLPSLRGIPYLYATESYTWMSGGQVVTFGYVASTPLRNTLPYIPNYSAYNPVTSSTARAMRIARKNDFIIPATEPRIIFSDVRAERPLADPFAGMPTVFRTAVMTASEAEIKSGQALNDILATIIDLDKRGIQADGSYLAPELFSDIRFAEGATGDLTNWVRAGEIDFPVLFQGEEYAIPRAWLRHDFGTAAGQLRSGKTPESAVAIGLQTAGRTIRRTFDEKKSSLSPADAKRGEQFLARFVAAMAIVRSPATADLIVTEWSSLGMGIVEFTQHLARHRLHFGPVPEGREETYRILHQALSEYAVSLAEQRR
jgi:hypothetical protein